MGEMAATARTAPEITSGRAEETERPPPIRSWRFDRKVRGRRMGETATCHQVPGAHDRHQPETVEPYRDLPGLGRGEGVLRMVHEAPLASSRRHGLWGDETGLRARCEGVDVLREHRQMGCGGESRDIGSRRGDRDRHPGGSSQPFEGAGDPLGTGPEGGGIGLQVDQ